MRLAFQNPNRDDLTRITIRPNATICLLSKLLKPKITGKIDAKLY